MSINTDARAWVEVNLDALRANFHVVRDSARPARGVLPMVKADAYGLGAARVVRALEPLEPWGYGVATVQEGIELREFGITRPVLVVAPMPPGLEAAAATAELTPAVSSLDALERWLSAAREIGERLDFHVEVDTGMGRAGFDWSRAAEWAPTVAARAGADARWAGVFTHFHSADERAEGGMGAARVEGATDVAGPDDRPVARTDPAGWESDERAQPTRVQAERFRAALDALPVPREQLIVHAANSAASLRWPQMGLDLVRPGIYLYGGAVPAVEPPAGVVSVRARLALVREVEAGATVGYGATYRAPVRRRWATLGIGYGDGVPRALGNRGVALVRGRRVPFRGRVSMDMIVVDVTDVPDAREGDVATLIGEDGEARVGLDEVAQRADTISYEILTGLTRRLPRLETER